MTDDFFGQDVSLQALAGDHVGESGHRQIRHVKFVDCELRGPAVIHPGPGFMLVSPAQFDLTQSEALQPLTPAQEIPSGAIVLDDCFLDGCRFHQLQFVGEATLLNYLFQYCVFGTEHRPFVAP